MKSIIEQASSIMKAIEKAWDQAEKPKEFSIKIFEQEERNFFGMSTKPAKIGIFFNDKPIAHEKSTSKPRQEIKECRSSFAKAPADRPKTAPNSQPQPQKIQQARPETSFAPLSPKVSDSAKASSDRPEDSRKATQGTAAAPRSQTKPIQHNTTEQPQPNASKIEKVRIPAAWNDTMIATAHNWLKKTLSLMNMTSIDFNSEVAGKNLKLTFNTPLIADAMHEKQLFRSFAHLIMSSLRNQYKQEIKDLKVILIRPE